MIQRDDQIEQSVEDYLRNQLFSVQGYPDSQVELLDSWQGEDLPTPLSKNFVAMGFNFDDGGKQAEAGSTLTVRVNTVEFFIIAKNATWGRNLSAAIKNGLEHDRIIPLKDIGKPGQPVIDAMPLLSVSRERQPIPNPEPWQKFIWTVHVKVEDTYYATPPV